MTSKELLDKYVRACIEIDREEKNYIPLRPLAVSLAEKEHLEREILKRIDEGGWHTGRPTEKGWYLFQFEDRFGIWFKMQYLDLGAIERLTEKNLLDDTVWQKIEPYKA